ncbi:MAG: hypothetical protein ABWZ88_01645 [Variovorax sp.]
MPRAGRQLWVSISLLGAAFAFAADAPGTPFDGAWTVMLRCPPHDEGDDDAKGYVHEFPAEIRQGVFRGVHGTEGQPSWHLLTGTVPADGVTTLKLEGIVSNPAYAINGAARGKAYSYRVRARFGADGGTGERLGKRRCDFLFRRR